jgi:3-hydroxyisobutyrate dehydrogenase-like beta-hydroxyacid dehydrogenase
MQKAGFIGLGVMGEPMCRNLAQKSDASIVGFDRDPAPLERLARHGVTAARSVKDLADGAVVVFLCLPSGEVVHELAHAPDGLLHHIAPGQIVVDCSTSSVDVTRKLQRDFAERGATFIDAPIARTRAAAEAGKLSVMVGADSVTFETVKPFISTFAEEITLCGAVGAGQVLKILNNMILFQIVTVLSEAKSIAEHAGVDAAVLFETLAKGSADSFALRNHGMKAVLTGDFPLRAFSVEYARKDLRYALQLAQSAGIETSGARTVAALFDQAIAAGMGKNYWPVISRLIGQTASAEARSSSP